MEQNTKEWLEWRRQGIGASDVPIIMGLSPWSTPHKLWLDKKGLSEPDNSNSFVKDRGHTTEVIARKLFQRETGKEWTEKLVQHKDFPHYRASLDGYNEDSNVLVEIKYVGAKAFADPKVPVHYYPQIQWQLFVSGAKFAHYIKCDGDTIRSCVVSPDLVYMKEKMIPAVEKFWELLQNNTTPKKTNKDSEVSHDDELKASIEMYAHHQERMAHHKKELELVKLQITENVKHDKTIIGDWCVQKITKKGNVDYSGVTELQGVDLEKHRKEESSFWKITKKK